MAALYWRHCIASDSQTVILEETLIWRDGMERIVEASQRDLPCPALIRKIFRFPLHPNHF
jgi:hypothetical protein